ncbi:MAG: hypothetical protein WAU75_22710 [Solirubrobacteraceae bacterium]
MQNLQALSPRRAALFLATLALLICGALVLGNASGAGARPVGHLALVKGNPVTVAGHGFRALRRVHLVLVDRGTTTRGPTANRNGAFTVTFPTAIDRCSGWSVTATQPGRAMVVLRSPAKPECAPLRTP